MTRRLLLMMAIGTAAVACSGDSEADSPTTAAPEATEAASTTSTAATTSTPTTTVAPTTLATTTVATTMAPTTTPATTTDPPVTTTTIDLESLLTPEAVIAAAQAADAAFVECGLQLPNCDTSVFDQTHTGQQLSQVVSQRTQDIASGNRIRNTEARRLVVMSVEFVDLDPANPAGVAANTEECVYDETVVFRIAADGSESVENDDAGTVLYERRYLLDQGRWKRSNAEVIAQTLGPDGCPT